MPIRLFQHTSSTECMLQKRQSSETPVGSNSETVDKEVSQETEITESDCQDTTPDPLASSAEQHRTRTVSRSFSYQKSKFSVSLYCLTVLHIQCVFLN